MVRREQVMNDRDHFSAKFKDFLIGILLSLNCCVYIYENEHRVR